MNIYDGCDLTKNIPNIYKYTSINLIEWFFKKLIYVCIIASSGNFG